MQVSVNTILPHPAFSRSDIGNLQERSRAPISPYASGKLPNRSTGNGWLDKSHSITSTEKVMRKNPAASTRETFLRQLTSLLPASGCSHRDPVHWRYILQKFGLWRGANTAGRYHYIRLSVPEPQSAACRLVAVDSPLFMSGIGPGTR